MAEERFTPVGGGGGTDDGSDPDTTSATDPDPDPNPTPPASAPVSRRRRFRRQGGAPADTPDPNQAPESGGSTPPTSSATPTGQARRLIEQGTETGPTRPRRPAPGGGQPRIREQGPEASRSPEPPADGDLPAVEDPQRVRSGAAIQSDAGRGTGEADTLSRGERADIRSDPERQLRTEEQIKQEIRERVAEDRPLVDPDEVQVEKVERTDPPVPNPIRDQRTADTTGPQYVVQITPDASEFADDRVDPDEVSPGTGATTQSTVTTDDIRDSEGGSPVDRLEQVSRNRRDLGDDLVPEDIERFVNREKEKYSGFAERTGDRVARAPLPTPLGVFGATSSTAADLAGQSGLAREIRRTQTNFESGLTQGALELANPGAYASAGIELVETGAYVTGGAGRGTLGVEGVARRSADVVGEGTRLGYGVVASGARRPTSTASVLVGSAGASARFSPVQVSRFDVPTKDGGSSTVRTLDLRRPISGRRVRSLAGARDARPALGTPTVRPNRVDLSRMGVRGDRVVEPQSSLETDVFQATARNRGGRVAAERTEAVDNLISAAERQRPTRQLDEPVTETIGRARAVPAGRESAIVDALADVDATVFGSAAARAQVENFRQPRDLDIAVLDKASAKSRLEGALSGTNADVEDVFDIKEVSDVPGRARGGEGIKFGRRSKPKIETDAGVRVNPVEEELLRKAGASGFFREPGAAATPEFDVGPQPRRPGRSDVREKDVADTEALGREIFGEDDPRVQRFSRAFSDDPLPGPTRSPGQSRIGQFLDDETASIQPARRPRTDDLDVDRPDRLDTDTEADTGVLRGSDDGGSPGRPRNRSGSQVIPSPRVSPRPSSATPGRVGVARSPLAGVSSDSSPAGVGSSLASRGVGVPTTSDVTGSSPAVGSASESTISPAATSTESGIGASPLSSGVSGLGRPSAPGSPVGFGGFTATSPPTRPRPRSEDDEEERKDRSRTPGQSRDLAVPAGDFLAPGWLSETVTRIATLGRGGTAPSQATLEAATSPSALVGERPTAEMLAGDEATQERIADVQGLLTNTSTDADQEPFAFEIGGDQR